MTEQFLDQEIPYKRKNEWKSVPSNGTISKRITLTLYMPSKNISNILNQLTDISKSYLLQRHQFVDATWRDFYNTLFSEILHNQGANISKQQFMEANIAINNLDKNDYTR